MGVELKKYRYEFILNDGDHLQEACYGIPCFKIFPFYELDFRGRGQKVLGYEIAELHRSVDKEREFFYALRFDTICEARFFLALFKWLLNHDDEEFAASSELQACRRAISKYITNTIVNSPFDDIVKQHEKNEQILARIREAEKPELTRVYAFHFDNNCTKIGVSDAVYRRMSQLETPPLEIDKIAYTKQTFTRERALQIEKECHEFFTPKHRCLEYFNITFEEACQKLSEYSHLFVAEDKYQINA